MSKRNTYRDEAADSIIALPFGTYNESFEPLSNGATRNLRDMKSDKNSYMPINVKAGIL